MESKKVEIGDTIKIIADTRGHGFEIGSSVEVLEIKGHTEKMYLCKSEDSNNPMFVFEHEFKSSPSPHPQHGRTAGEIYRRTMDEWRNEGAKSDSTTAVLNAMEEYAYIRVGEEKQKYDAEIMILNDRIKSTKSFLHDADKEVKYQQSRVSELENKLGEEKKEIERLQQQVTELKEQIAHIERRSSGGGPEW